MLKSVFKFLEFDFPDASNRRTEDKPNGKIVYLTGQQLMAELGPYVASIAAQQKGQIQPESRPVSFRNFKPFYDNTEPKRNPPNKVITCESPVKPINKDFKRRSAAGEIVLSNFYNWGAIISYQNGRTEEQAGLPTSAIYDCTSIDGINQRDNRFVIYNGYMYECRIRIKHVLVRYSDMITPFEAGWSDPSYIHLNLLSMETLGPDIQALLADHNSRTVDVLTAMAEMPETLRSIINGIKVVIRMYLQAKKKEFRLRNSVATWKNAKTSDKSRRQAIRDAKELADAISDVWLNFRYNIQPTAYLIKDSLEVLSLNEPVEFIRDRFRVVDNEFNLYNPPQGWEGGKIELTHRCMIKSRVKVDDSINYQALLSADIFRTAWELIPLSFVVDWFISIGDRISTIVPASNIAQGSTYSWKIDDSVTYKHESGCSVTIDFKLYKRRVIDPAQFCEIYINPDFNLTRQFDALALSWKMFITSKIKNLH